MMRINGRRGAFLLLFGAVHLIVGLSYLLPTPTTGVAQSLGALTSHGVPVWVCGIPWIPAAITAWIGAFKVRDGFGFQALVVMDVLWACVYVASWLLTGYTRGFLLASLFAALGGAVIIVSGMVSASTVSRVQRGDL